MISRVAPEPDPVTPANLALFLVVSGRCDPADLCYQRGGGELPSRPRREENLLHLDGQVHHDTHALPMGDYVTAKPLRSGELIADNRSATVAFCGGKP